MRFKYTGEKNNIKVNGIIDASDSNEASLILFDQGINLINLKEVGFIDEYLYKIKAFKTKTSKVKLEELIVLTRQFATLFDAGIPVVKILDRMSKQNFSEKLLTAILKIKEDVEAGLSLSAAFGRQKGIFSPLYINMLKVGEEGGVLDIVLSRLADILETDLETRNRIKHATRYPKLTVGAIAVAFSILVVFVIPKFVGLFNKFKAELPLPTKILIWINYFVQNYWWLIIFIIFSAIFAYKKYKSTEKGKVKIDLLVFKIPIIGPILHKIYISRITRILGLLYRSGIPVVSSFDIVSEVSGNEIIKKEIQNVKIRVSQGNNIAASFGYSEYFPEVVTDMIAAGEETGRLDEMLEKIADYYDEETDYAIKNLSTAIEPILLVLIAGMVILLALGVFLPMWDMIKVIK
ncbi:type II secretion system F family protein [Deferribacterales bacterium Es71-Z0220]|uniref:type II secretion system F family protein n=1 Tax=Deferrivibrio essentukiensis TaxID=2880922 RepID=UPI001F61265A|nr:type II secretion system F family protein [Deferrivibrio essentukiensis]MCB4204521.1 type II secretion system F family protein [Deferrivibrio essentukiensis]